MMAVMRRMTVAIISGTSKHHHDGNKFSCCVNVLSQGRSYKNRAKGHRRPGTNKKYDSTPKYISMPDSRKQRIHQNSPISQRNMAKTWGLGFQGLAFGFAGT